MVVDAADGDNGAGCAQAAAAAPVDAAAMVEELAGPLAVAAAPEAEPGAVGVDMAVAAGEDGALPRSISVRTCCSVGTEAFHLLTMVA